MALIAEAVRNLAAGCVARGQAVPDPVVLDLLRDLCEHNAAEVLSALRAHKRRSKFFPYYAELMAHIDEIHEYNRLMNLGGGFCAAQDYRKSCERNRNYAIQIHRNTERELIAVEKTDQKQLTTKRKTQNVETSNSDEV